MAGGDADGYALVQPLLEDLAFDDQAVLFVGEPGSGHFSKLIHNAVEFGMVQAIAEGVELLERSEFKLDLPALFDNWAHGSVIRSWLIELMRDALQEHPDLERLATYVEDTGEVKWVLDWALARDIPSPVVAQSQQALMTYRDVDLPAAKAVALLRHGSGAIPSTAPTSTSCGRRGDAGAGAQLHAHDDWPVVRERILRRTSTAAGKEAGEAGAADFLVPSCPGVV